MITAVVMVAGESGKSTPNDWVQGARRAAARDLIQQLAQLDLVSRIIVVSPSLSQLSPSDSVDFLQSAPGSIHVGQYLAEIVIRYGVQRLLYFGGGAAPLLDDLMLAGIVNQLAATEEGIFTNNQFASDWAGITPASILMRWTDRLPKDNMLGWVLSTEAGLPIKPSPPSAASRLDIDTPIDLLTLRLHPDTKINLRQFLFELPIKTDRIEAVLSVLATPAAHVLIAGRLGPDPWRAINQATQCWYRVISEERGMVSSGRLTQGAVFSLLADYIATAGLHSFFQILANQVSAALFDTRVLLAHHGRWPSDDDRFASDLGLVDQITDPWLREFTSAVDQTNIPILLGGHGLLSGDLFAFCELL